ncbi:hypothetical protein NPX99_07775 [Bartonella sp. 220]|uniref:hypothetical protein n=1 Tax=Bartonella sp. 220B TaxID=2967260 RepID=UPI0022A9B729|nr:hypothetical protein [Bartonella sp. 220B]MCZ2159145.1 hypothetical protein [Bartonella sp. 220B]
MKTFFQQLNSCNGCWVYFSFPHRSQVYGWLVLWGKIVVLIIGYQVNWSACAG